MKGSKVNKSYQAILHHAKALFWKHGIRRITVEEICQESGVSKMTFYRLFTNKQEVAEKVLDDLLESNMQKYRSIMNQDIHFTEKIKQVIELKYVETIDISQEFLKDVFHRDELGLKDNLEEYRQNVVDELMKDLKVAQKEGWIKRDVKPEFILFMMNKSNEMLMDERFQSMYKNTQEAIMELTNFFFYGIISKETSTS